MIEIDGEQWLTQTEVCELLGISVATWRATRRRGRGPQDGLVHIGRRVYLKRSSIGEWLTDCGESTDLTPAEPTAQRAGDRLSGGAPVSSASHGERSLFAGVGDAVKYGAR